MGDKQIQEFLQQIRKAFSKTKFRCPKNPSPELLRFLLKQNIEGLK